MNLPLQFSGAASKTGQVINVTTERIRPNPSQPRHTFDLRALEELAESIKSFGILQPISVRRTSQFSYEVVAGERRLRAAKMAGLESVPVIVVNMDESDSAVAALLENIQRENLTYMEEAQGYFYLTEQQHMTQEEIAKKVGKSQSAVANKMRLLNLPPSVKKILSDNSLSERHARALLRLGDEEKMCAVLKTVCEKELNVAQTEKLVAEMLEECEPKKSRKNFYIGNEKVKIIINTLRKSVNMIKEAGMEAHMREKDRGDYIEYTIRVKKEGVAEQRGTEV